MAVLEDDVGRSGSDETPPPPIEIPFTSLSAEAQEGVLNDFIYREGTDYGAQEASLERKQADILRQLERGDVKLIFDPSTESVTLITAREWKKSNTTS
jgi:uncharacterized protein YheU (UPF0270 family)